jgi:hypothetical protein
LSGSQLESKRFKPQTIRVVKKRAFNPLMISGGEKTSTNQTKSMENIRLEILKVTILKGKVILFRIGLIKKFRKPRTAPTKTRESKKGPIFERFGATNNGPVKATPGTNLADSQSPKIPAAIWRIKDHHILAFYQLSLLKSIRR